MFTFIMIILTKFTLLLKPADDTRSESADADSNASTMVAHTGCLYFAGEI